MEILSPSLDDADALEPLFVQAARAAGATVLGASFHSFEPQGVSGVVLLAESHLTVHTWPEHRYAAVDLFSCSEHIRIEPVVEVLKAGLGGGEFRVSAALSRGVVERISSIAAEEEPELSWRARYEALAPSGMSLSVDVEGCALLPEGEALLEPLLEVLSGRGRGVGAPVVRCHAGETTVFGCLEQGHWIALLEPLRASLRFDLFSRVFVEPLAFALRLRNQFRGRHHAFTCTFRR